MEKEEVNKAFGNENETVDHKTEEQEENINDGKKEVPEHEGVPSDDDKNQSKKTYTKDEVDAMMARARKKYTKGDSKKEETPEQEVVENQDKETTKEVQEPQNDLSTGLAIDKLARAELKAQMAIDGVNPAKLVYACKMIDVADVLENGEYNEEKAKTAIEEMLKVMPELKATQQQEQNQFYFGAPEQEEQKEEKNVIDKIFGN